MQSGAIHTIKVPIGLNLVEAEARPFIEELFELAKTTHAKTEDLPKAIVLWQEGAQSDWSASFLAELQNDILLDELVVRVQQFRLLLQLIRHSPVPWIYVCHGNCLGSWFELASACFCLVSGHSNYRIGYPAIGAGLYPFGGTVENTGAKIQSFAEWQNNSVFTFADINLRHIFSMQVHRDHWEEEFHRWFEKDLDRRWVEHRTMVQRVKIENIEETEASFHTNLSVLKQVRSDWLKNVKLNETGSSWDVCAELFRKHKKDIPALEWNKIVAFFAAREMVGARFLSWFEGTAPRLFGLSSQAASGIPKLIYVDLSSEVPPAESLVRLLRRGCKLVFFHETLVELRQGLELVYARLEKHLTFEPAQSYWQNGIFWCVKEAEKISTPILRWTVDDRIAFIHQGETLEWWRVSGNRGRAPSGICEWVGGKTLQAQSAVQESMAYQTLMALCDYLVCTKPSGVEGLPLSIVVRSLVFEELLRCSYYTQRDVTEVVEELGRAGWRLIGAQGFWNRFLATRSIFLPIDAGRCLVGSKKLNQDILDVGLWKEARFVVAKLKLNQPAVLWTSAQLSDHFAVLAGLLCLLLAQLQLVDSLMDADAFINHCLGFPPDKGGPLQFVSKRGIARVQAEVATHWPEFNELWVSWAKDK